MSILKLQRNQKVFYTSFPCDTMRCGWTKETSMLLVSKEWKKKKLISCHRIFPNLHGLSRYQIRMTFEVNLKWHTHTHAPYWITNTKLIEEFLKLFWSLQSLKSHNNTQIECGCRRRGLIERVFLSIVYHQKIITFVYGKESDDFVKKDKLKCWTSFVVWFGLEKCDAYSFSLWARIALKRQHLSSTHRKQLGSSEWIALR